jgi:hypothetical protein
VVYHKEVKKEVPEADDTEVYELRVIRKMIMEKGEEMAG